MFLRCSIIIVFIVWAASAYAQEQRSLQQRADAHFQRAEYAPAAALYEVIVRKKPSAEIMEKLATSYRAVNKYEAAAGWYEKLLQQPGAAAINKRYYGDMLKSMGQYEAAKVQYSSWSSEGNAQQLIAGCDSAMAWLKNPVSLQWQDLTALNTPNSDWGTVKYGDKIVFVSDRGNDKRRYKRNKHPFLKLYTAQPNGAYVSSFHNAMDHFPYHSGPVCFSRNEDTAWLTVTYPRKVNFEKAERPAVYGNRRLELLTYVKKGATWALLAPFPHNNTAAFSLGHAAISNDGNILYYTSDQPGGVGQTDIWYSTRLSDSSWSAPVNCGPQINTTEAEEFPVIAPDGTLYFSSKGHAGMGGFDVFAAKGEGKQWSTPLNMRVPVNSSADDFSFMIDGQSRGYLSSNRKGGIGDDDIYAFIMEMSKTPFVEPDRKVLILAATVLDKLNNNPVPEAFTLISQPPKDRQWTQITPADGTNYLVLNNDSKYTAAAYKGGRKALPVEVSTAGRTGNDTIRVTLYLDAQTVKESLAIENIYYDFNKSSIRADAAAILDKLVTLLQEHPSATVLLTAHTDVRGSDAYNITLSSHRAAKAKEYLLQKGIPAARIATGFQGKRAPADDCDPCNEARHQSNRRTNIQILKN
ncbi:OmpA family protein [Chitinophaga niabensis]|uniref:Outer membrane protein OmpA n=1 Tax=Chitinophaga niabensis TaxID=536979 RepID=A0A1N6J8E9_9BACT|nr:OmpA family protein [Chitinophaga niabensis]SIO40523.1 Outer membrane protein OmpA [Chitinophaga niabensis]